MTLVDRQILERVEKYTLIDSFDTRCLTNIGYDLRAKQFYVGKSGESSLTLQPNESAFVESVEIIDMPHDLLGRVTLKNSRIRQGLSIDAPVYQPGHKTRVYFRLTNVSADSITLDRGEKYATISFEQLGGNPDKPYTGKFSDEFDYRGMGDYQDIYKHQIRAIERKTENLREVENSIYANVMVILSVFVALFTFLTTNVSLAANSATIEHYFLFNFLLMGCIGFLVALVSTVIRRKKAVFWIWAPSIVCFTIALLIFIF